MEAIQIVHEAIALYKEIQDAPEQVEKVGKRMERLEGYLIGLKELLGDKSRLAILRPAQTQEIKAVIKDIEGDAEKVYEILKKWENNIGPFGLELRFKTIGQALFAIGSSPDKLESLSQDIEQHKTDLRDILQLLGWFGVDALLPGTPSTNTAKRPKSPLPHPAKNDYNIIFVDSTNVNCSRVAEAYVKLVQEWTVRTHGDWRIKLDHSAGLGVRNGSDCMGALESIKPALTLRPGNDKPNETAMAALFDNKLFNHPYKKVIRDTALTRTSRGVTEKLFKTYDFVLVFSGRDYEAVAKLKQALTEKGGVSLVPKGKCRVIQVGSYLAKNGKPVDIWPARKNADGTHSRETWNSTVSNLKIAIKAFLKSELGWVQPK
ncbi:hypothetical protein EJ08DRAFT_591503 [Tothia fuscella]|uniref:Uncharacterized protein n=1 Tax=Tothia fuscella TaxID=1048955 RepID=A0A9P4NNZ2_9PEZI|nr:hypothetical protein EJ08DRAFT_591503 [Tothia fuscella]